MKIAGIDYSINSPAVVKIDTVTQHKWYLAFTQVKKEETVKHEGMIHYYKKNQFKNSFEQNNYIKDMIMDILKDVDIISIEGYAFSGTGRVNDISEATGNVKYAIYNSGKKLRIFEPTTIKMYACYNGIADKIMMEEHYNKRSDKFDLSFLKGHGASPSSDIIDAHYIALLLQLELEIRAGRVDLAKIHEKHRQIFQRTSKACPNNLLMMDFLEK